MPLYLKLFLSTGLPFGVLMAVTSDQTGSVGDFAGAAALYGIIFGFLMTVMLGTLQRWGERRELAKRTKREESRHGQAG